MKKRLLRSVVGLMVLFLMVSAAKAQTVSGKVTSRGEPLPGVSILVKGTSTGTSTNANGEFTITVPDNNAVLVLSFIGFTTQEVAVNNQTNINIEMSEDATQLSEVVVTALGIEREAKTLVYATQTVKTAELTEVRDANNILNSLQGKVANAVVTQGSGGPGSGARIVLRGNRSIQGSNNALIVVDGIPINNDTYSTATSDFGSVAGSDGASNINPDDIESMTILRGASAAALYGSAAGNGVIVITTKKGRAERMSVDINSGITSERVFILPSFQNAYGQGNGGVLDPASGESWGARMEGQPYTNYLGEQRTYSPQPDNIKDFFRTGVSLNNSIGISGGSEKMQTYLSYTNNKIQGIIPKNDLTRHTVNVRLSNQITSKFSTDAKVTYMIQDIENKPRTGEENAPVINLYQMPRNVSLDDAKNFETFNDLNIPVPTTWPSTLTSIYMNPYWMVNRTAVNETRDRVIGFITAKYEFTNWLNLQGRVTLDKSFDRFEEIYSHGTILWAVPTGGVYIKNNIEITQKWFDLILQGRNDISDDLSVNYTVGGIYQDMSNDRNKSTANGLNVTNKFQLNYATTSIFDSKLIQTRINSVFGQASLSYKDAIFLEGSVRNDWDSRLPSPNTILYPSVGLSAVFSDLIPTLSEPLSFLKASINYAEVGNGGQPQIRFNTYSYTQGAGQGFIARNPTQAIPDLKPEIVKNLEFGIDVRLLNSRIGLNATYYKSNSINQLLTLEIPVPTGYSKKYINAGDIQNRGVELVLNGTPVSNGTLRWEVAFNLGINRNKIIELDPYLKETTLGGGYGRSATPIIKEGGSYGDLIAYKWQRDAGGRLMVTDEGLPSIKSAEKQEYIGNFNPKAIMGLTNTLDYKQFWLRVLIDGRSGGVVVSGEEMNLAFSGITGATEKYREGGWNLGGVNGDGQLVEETITAQEFWQIASGKRYGNGEFFAYDATNYRVREISLGYNIPVPESFFIKSAKISVVARNVFWLYRGKSILDIPGLGRRKMSFDPDMSLGNGNFQGVQYGTLPSTRSIGFNLQLSF